MPASVLRRASRPVPLGRACLTGRRGGRTTERFRVWFRRRLRIDALSKRGRHGRRMFRRFNAFSIRLCLMVSCLVVASSPAWAQATIAGLVRDASGAVLPGVTVEAASPALIEKVRTAVTDGAGRYRIESLQPGDYTVTFTLPGFATVRREGLIVSGIGGDHRGRRDARRRRAGDDHRHRRNADRGRAEHQARDHARQRDHAEPARSPQLQLPARRGSRACRPTATTSTPVRCSLIFPIHGGRGVESRLTVDGPEHQQPARRQPAAELHRRHRQRAGSDDDDVGRPRRDGDRRPDDEHRPEAGRQQLLGPGLRLRLLGGDAGGQLHPRVAGARRHAADAGLPASTTSTCAVGGPIVTGQALVLHERPQSGFDGRTC